MDTVADYCEQPIRPIITEHYDGKELVNSRGENGRVQSVTKSNVNAFTMAPSTFTENGDGYLAVQKFTAI